MTIYTFYAIDSKDFLMYVAGTVDSETGEFAGIEAESLENTVNNAKVDIRDEEQLLRTFWNGSRMWIREGPPWPPLVERDKQRKAARKKETPKVTFSRSNESGNS